MSLTPPDPTPGGEPAPVGPAVGAWNVRGSQTPRRGRTPAHPAWIAMAAAVGLEFAGGLATLLLAPIGRPSGLLPHRGRLVFDIHAAFGVLVVVGAMALVVTARRSSRVLRIASRVALAGVLVSAVGGLATVDHGLRVLGIGLMFVGSLVAGFAYLVGVLEPSRQVDDEQAGTGTG